MHMHTNVFRKNLQEKKNRLFYLIFFLTIINLFSVKKNLRLLPL